MSGGTLAGVVGVLASLARDLGVDEGSVRLAAAGGTLRLRSGGSRLVDLEVGEREYLLRHWGLLSALISVLEVECDVCLAVLFGSVARGDEDEGSDVDLVVGMHDVSLARMGRLRRRLRDATDRTVHLVLMSAVTDSPSLMADVVQDGRVLLDRAGAWPAMKDQEGALREVAEARLRDAEARARAVFAYYARLAGR